MFVIKALYIDIYNNGRYIIKYCLHICFFFAFICFLWISFFTTAGRLQALEALALGKIKFRLNPRYVIWLIVRPSKSETKEFKI